MKKQFTKKLMAGVLAIVCCLTSVISAYAASSSDITYNFAFNDIGQNRVYAGFTQAPYTCTWIRITTSAQKYPSGNALLPNLSTTENNNDFVIQARTAYGYTSKMTVYGAHSMYVGGKAYIKYTTNPNV